MPQEFIVMRCFQCKKFQVHQIRKDCKFVCKMCGVKQSKKRVYCQGSAKDCRSVVQSLNLEECRQLETLDNIVEHFQENLGENELENSSNFARNFENLAESQQKASNFDKNLKYLRKNSLDLEHSTESSSKFNFHNSRKRLNLDSSEKFEQNLEKFVENAAAGVAAKINSGCNLTAKKASKWEEFLDSPPEIEELNVCENKNENNSFQINKKTKFEHYQSKTKHESERKANFGSIDHVHKNYSGKNLGKMQKEINLQPKELPHKNKELNCVVNPTVTENSKWNQFL